MKMAVSMLALGGLVIAASAQTAPTKGAERGLIGINLFDKGIRVIQIYGTPDEVQAVSPGQLGQPGGGGGAPGGGFGPSGAPGGFGGQGFGGGRGSPGAGTPQTGADFKSPFGFANDLLQFAPGGRGQGAPPGLSGAAPGGGGAPGGFPGGPGGFPGAQGGFPGAPGGFPGAPGGGATPPRGFGGAAEVTTFTRWIYNRGGSRYGFVLDKFGRVIQIEAIGLQNAKVKTRKGLGFGATFAQIVKAYSTPDSYEIAGDNIVMKYLSRQKVAFRLSRLGPKKPQVVTGVVVAAGKG